MPPSLGRRLFVFCAWMMAITLMPFVLAITISLLYKLT